MCYHFDGETKFIIKTMYKIKVVNCRYGTELLPGQNGKYSPPMSSDLAAKSPKFLASQL